MYRRNMVRNYNTNTIIKNYMMNAIMCIVLATIHTNYVHAISIVDKNASLTYYNSTHGQTCATFFYPNPSVNNDNNNNNISCNGTLTTNCTNTTGTTANNASSTKTNNTISTDDNSNKTNSSSSNNSNNTNVTSTNTTITSSNSSYVYKCYICPINTFVNQTYGGCTMQPCNSSFAYTNGYCIGNQSTVERSVVIDVTRVVYTNESLALINILSTFILENDSYVIWNLIFAVTVLTYVSILLQYTQPHQPQYTGLTIKQTHARARAHTHTHA
jgi:hypothetical protein